MSAIQRELRWTAIKLYFFGMISICIPVYNFDAGVLVQELSMQIRQMKQDVEIVMIDDASELSFRDLNRSLPTVTHYIQLDQNIGRARIRNLFLNYTNHPYLLFLDCDGSVSSNPDFLENYLRAIETGARVVCGGRIYPEKCPSGNQALSWKYGRSTESRSASKRSLNAGENFMTNNFLIEKKLFASILFEETIIDYGHEDTLLGINLDNRNEKIIHIENPVLNLHIEKNEIFLEKTRQGINNLVKLISTSKLDPGDYKKIRLLKTYMRLKKYGLDKLWGYCYAIQESRIINNLKSEAPSLFLFKAYKLGVLHKAYAASAVR